METEWILQLGGLGGGVRTAWLLQSEQYEQVPAVETFAQTQLPEILASLKARIKFSTIYRRTISLGTLHETFFSNRPLTEYTDEQLLDDDVRATLLNYPKGFEEVDKASRRGDDTYVINIDGRINVDQSFTESLMTFLCTESRRVDCMAHAQSLAEAWHNTLPTAQFKIRIDTIVSPNGALTKLALKDYTSAHLAAIYNVLENAGINGVPPTKPLNDFQRGVLWGLGTYMLDPPGNAVYASLEPRQRKLYDKLQKRAGNAVLAMIRD